MKIAIIAATGQLGSILTQKLLQQDVEVTAIVKSPDKITDKRVNILHKNLFDLTTADIMSFDRVISAYGPAVGNETELNAYMDHLIKIFSAQVNARLIICGGVGPTYFDEQRTLQVSDSPDLPAEVVALANNETASFNRLSPCAHIKWTYMAPALNLDLNGLELGQYGFFNDVLHFTQNGENALSYLDYASAVIEESLQEQGRLQQIVSVADV